MTSHPSCRMLFVFGAVLLAVCLASPRPVTLPGAPAVNFSLYSGYVTVDPNAQRNLFYVFAESQRSPASDPVLLWFTGGPGCSGLLAMMSENGE
jgi:hypothetical protein